MPDGFGGLGITSRQCLVEFVKRGAIGADGFAGSTHVNEDMRVVMGRQGADAHEFLRPHLNCGQAHGILEMRCCASGHVIPQTLVFARDR